MSRTQVFILADDGLVPNNEAVAVRHYHGLLDVSSVAPEQAIIATFAANGWGDAWVNGIYPFHHYHARSHEVLGIARGSARVQLGGSSGPVLELEASDAVLIPAGVGHCRLAATGDLSVVGAYPAGQGAYDMKRATIEDRALALPEIRAVALPARDPVDGTPFGAAGRRLATS